MLAFSKLMLAAGLVQVALAAALPRHDIETQGLSVQEQELPIRCAHPGVQIIGARGTGQDKGTMGTMQYVANAIEKTYGGNQAVPLEYKASMAPTYQGSEGQGAYNMTQYIEFYAKRCPKTKLVLLGYSQVRSVDLVLKNV